MIKLGGLVSQKAFGKFEMGKVISNPFANSFVNEGVDMDKLEFELKHLKKNNPGKKVEYHFIKSSEYPNGYYFTVNKKIIKNIFKNEATGSEDHEVSMANNSLDSIIKNATELKSKIGEIEKNIPGWIQDHITNSENYIEQANSGYHEINEGKINELAPSDIHVKQIMNFYDKGTYSTKKAVSIYVSNKLNANRNQILDDLGDMGYDEILDIVDHFKLDEKYQSSKLREAAPCWKGYTQYGMKDKNGKEVPNCVPNESIVKEGRGIKSIQNDYNKTIVAIQSELEAFKSSKGTSKAGTHVDNLKKLNVIKNKLEKELENTVSSLYKDAELKIED
jgi:hypothetical protein